MFSRTTSNASARLRRAKSSASMSGNQSPSRADSIDPEVSRQHALAAASYAFQRAHERGVAGGVVVSNLSRNNSKASSHLERGRSLARKERILGTRKTIKERERSRISHEKSDSTSSFQRQPPYDGVVDPYSIVRYEEYCTPEDDIASTPSSYRRLRKAKSMITPRKPARITYTSSRTPFEREAEQEKTQAGYTAAPHEPKPFLRGPKSMSFLRPNRAYPHPPAPSSPAHIHAEATQVARTLFLAQQENRRLRAQASFVLTAQAKRQQKVFRKTVRTSSLTSYGSGVSSGNQTVLKTGSSLGEKARKLSFSIRETFKRVFQKGAPSSTTGEGREGGMAVRVPSQQVEASRRHFRDYNVDPTEGLDQRYGDSGELTPPQPHFQMRDGEVLSRVSSGCPSLREVPRDLQLVAPQMGRISGAHSRGGGEGEGDVMSDDETDATNSWGTRKTAAEAEEMRRLSRIQGNGRTHQPSTAGSRYDQKGYSVFTRPMRTNPHLPEGSTSPVDSARVYSALMRRIDEKSPNRANIYQAGGDSANDETPIPRSGSAATQLTSYSQFDAHAQGPGSAATEDRFYTPAAFPLSRPGSVGTGTAGHGQRGMVVRPSSVASKRSFATIRPVAEGVGGFENHGHGQGEYRGVRQTRSVVFNPLKRKESIEEHGEYRGVRQSRSVVFNPLRGREDDDVFSVASGSQDGRQSSWEGESRSFGLFQAAGGEARLTPQQIADLNERHAQEQSESRVPSQGRVHIQNHILREARSTFFPNHGGPRITTPSPYKRALSKASQEDDEGRMVALAGEGWRLGFSHTQQQQQQQGGLRKISEGGNSVGRRLGSQVTLGGSSVYSRTTSGETPQGKESTLSLGQMDTTMWSSGQGLSEIPVQKPIAAPAAHPVAAVVGAATVGKEKRDWKGWMASEIAGLNRMNEERFRRAQIRRGHQREGAQIDGEDTKIGSGQDYYNQARERNPLLAGGVALGMPLGGVHGNAVPLLPPPRMGEKGMFPLVDIDPLSAVPEVPPKSPLRSGVRATASTTSLRSSTFQSSVGYLNASRDRLLKARSLADIKNLSRYSPGRARQMALARETGKAATLKEGAERDENSSPTGQSPYREDVEGAGILGRSQQRVVDLFLSNRRRKMRGSGSHEGEGEGEGEDAFL